MKKYDLELFDKKTMNTASDPVGPGGEEITDSTPSGDPCNGLKEFENEGTVLVEHSCNSIYLDITVYNSSGIEIGATKEILNEDSFRVTITPSESGYLVWEKIK